MNKLATKIIGIILAILSILGIALPTYAQWDPRTYSILEQQADEASDIVARLYSHLNSNDGGVKQ